MEEANVDYGLYMNYNSEEASTGNKRKREGRLRSKVWQDFTKILNEEGKCEKCQCNHCQKLFMCSSRSGTTHLLRHIADGICPVFKKDKGKSSSPASLFSAMNGLVILPWGSPQKQCVGVELGNGKVGVGMPLPASSSGGPDYSVSAALQCLNEMEDISQSSEMYLDAVEIMQDGADRECFICLLSEPRRRWLQRVLHRRHPGRYSSNL